VMDYGLLTHIAHVALDVVFVSGTTIGQAGGTLATPATLIMFTTDSSSATRFLAIEVTTSASSKAAAIRKLGAVVTIIAD
jgi:hypothetical protein